MPNTEKECQQKIKHISLKIPEPFYDEIKQIVKSVFVTLDNILQRALKAGEKKDLF